MDLGPESELSGPTSALPLLPSAAARLRPTPDRRRESRAVKPQRPTWHSGQTYGQRPSATPGGGHGSLPWPVMPIRAR